MEVKQIKLVYFSATGTTKTVLESIAKGIDVEDVEHINVTLPECASQTIPPFSNELFVVPASVYVQRQPFPLTRAWQRKPGDAFAVVPV